MYTLLGYLFAVITAGCWTQNSLIYTYLGKRIGSSTVTHMRTWIAFPAAVLLNLIFTGSIIPRNLFTISYLYIGASGLLGFFVADLFIFKAFQHNGARNTMVIMTLSPLFSAAFSWIIFKEVLSPFQITGVFITIGGVVAVILSENSNDGDKPSKIWTLFALTGAVVQAAGMILAKAGLTTEVKPLSANVVRIGFGLGGLILFSLLHRNFISDFTRMRTKRYFYLLTAAALVGPVFGMLLALYAFTWAPVGIVTTLMQLTPVLLLGIDVVYFHKKVPAAAAAGTLIAVAGAGILFLAR